VGIFLERSCGRGKQHQSTAALTVQHLPLERGSNNYYSIMQGNKHWKITENMMKTLSKA